MLGRPVEITFEFDYSRNFTAIHLHMNNYFTKDVQVSAPRPPLPLLFRELRARPGTTVNLAITHIATPWRKRGCARARAFEPGSLKTFPRDLQRGNSCRLLRSFRYFHRRRRRRRVDAAAELSLDRARSNEGLSSARSTSP